MSIYDIRVTTDLGETYTLDRYRKSNANCKHGYEMWISRSI